MGGIDGWQWLRKLDCKNYSCKVPVLDHDGKLIPYFEFEASQTDRCWRGLFFHFFMITSTSQLNCPMFKIWRGRVWEIRKNFYYKILRSWCYHSRTDSLLLKAKDDHTCELGQFMNKTFETLHAKFALCLPWMKIFLSFYDYLSKQFRHAQVKIDHNWVFVEKHIRSHGKTWCFCSEIAKLWLQACYMCCMHNYAWQVVLDDWPFFLKTFSLSWCKQLFFNWFFCKDLIVC